MIKNPKLYEINTAVWLYELSLKHGANLRLRDVPTDEWDRLADSGFHYIWLMGIWKRSKEGMRIFRGEDEYKAFRSHLDFILPVWSDDDIPGSPYSIAAYEPEPLFGDWDDIDRIREELHKREMKLILDFVPNHTAPDHPWISDHPEYYIQGGKAEYKKDPSAFSPIKNDNKVLYIARGKDPYFPSWSDTAQLNYFNPDMRMSLIEELKKISEYCDGVRCDMAMLVLNKIYSDNWKWARPGTYTESGEEFWEELRREIPGLLLIAEAYWGTGPHLLELGFDYVYDKEFYDLLLNAFSHEITNHLKSHYSYQKKLVRFIENHDEPRSAEVFDRDKMKAITALFSTVPGLKLYHQGQLEGKKIRIPVQVRRAIKENSDDHIKTLYEKILRITGHDAFLNGEWELKNVIPGADDSYHHLIAYTWKINKALKLIVVNLSGHSSQGMIPLQNEIDTHSEYIFLDELSDEKYIRNGDDVSKKGLHVILDRFNAHIFDIAQIQRS